MVSIADFIEIPVRRSVRFSFQYVTSRSAIFNAGDHHRCGRLVNVATPESIARCTSASIFSNFCIAVARFSSVTRSTLRSRIRLTTSSVLSDSVIARFALLTHDLFLLTSMVGVCI